MMGIFLRVHVQGVFETSFPNSRPCHATLVPSLLSIAYGRLELDLGKMVCMNGRWGKWTMAALLEGRGPVMYCLLAFYAFVLGLACVFGTSVSWSFACEDVAVRASEGGYRLCYCGFLVETRIYVTSFLTTLACAINRQVLMGFVSCVFENASVVPLLDVQCALYFLACFWWPLYMFV